jgi:hypothetical protein
MKEYEHHVLLSRWCEQYLSRRMSHVLTERHERAKESVFVRGGEPRLPEAQRQTARGWRFPLRRWLG